MIRLPVLALVPAVILLCPGPAAAAGGTSLADARTQPATRLADRVLSQFAGQLVAVRRPPGEVLSTLEFSTRPKSAGFPGLCMAKIVMVEMRYDGQGAGLRTPARAEDLSLREVYRIVGDTKPIPGGWNEPYGRWLDSNCGRFADGLDFFSASTPAAAWRGAQVMAQILPGPDGKTASSVAVSCANRGQACDIPAMLAKLGDSGLGSVEETPCNAEAPDGLSCMTLIFAIDRTAAQDTIVTLRVVLKQREPFPVEIVRASISGVRAAAD
ncbi:hypothetical protein QO010_001240 [Caulobacter ginsengisoli]|uniref:Beta-lactamase n=1 Tax=Caulobacter ginsengisoli TaxID=400775 RepID=A0ABU0IR22_9CAUL|nr:hypothetical protein [Caulobacter ginsengisoli]MDQ0463469.1 hypothetical protein [Caulobacter ginsengisoli]